MSVVCKAVAALARSHNKQSTRSELSKLVHERAHMMILSRFIDASADSHSCTYARQNTYDPKFATHIETEYHFERKQQLIFRILVRRVKLSMID